MILSSESEASLLGCMAILPRFTYLSVVNYLLFNKNFATSHPGTKVGVVSTYWLGFLLL